MALKNITLTGTEIAVTGLDGSNAAIRNDGAGVIYAAKQSGITPGADGVLSIPVGGSAVLHGIVGEIFALGTGAATIISSDFNDNPFKSAAQGGSGADEVARAAISEHAGNDEIHITADEKAGWNAKANLSDIPTELPASDVSEWAKQPNKPDYTAAEVGADPSGTGADVLATARGYTDAQIAALVNGAPETLDTLKELADAIRDNDSVVEALNEAIGTKANKSDIPTTLPANGGNAATVNGHSVNSDVPANAKFTDTVYTHPTSAGNKHIPAGGAAGQILRWGSNGTAVWGADQNTTYANMTGATASAAGKSGLVPAPAAGASTRYLRSDGTWQVPPDTNTTYGAASASANGIMTTGAQTFAGNKAFNGQILPNGATAYGTPQARKLSSGTAAATTSNCPAGAWYGQHS